MEASKLANGARLICTLGVLCLGASAWQGCGDRPPGASSASYSAPRPDHPAMTDPAVTRRAGEAPDAHAGLQEPELPPGHPPIPARSADASGTPAGPEGAPPGNLKSALARFGLDVTVPRGWQEEVSSSSMRLGTFRLQRADGDPEDAEVSVSAAMGSEEANIDRWRRQQFKENPEPVTARREVPGMKLTVTEMEGTFLASGGAKPGTRLWGAIVRLSGADNLIFFKAWGPKATMEKWKSSFEDLAASLKPAGK